MDVLHCVFCCACTDQTTPESPPVPEERPSFRNPILPPITSETTPASSQDSSDLTPFLTSPNFSSSEVSDSPCTPVSLETKEIKKISPSFSTTLSELMNFSHDLLKTLYTTDTPISADSMRTLCSLIQRLRESDFSHLSENSYEHTLLSNFLFQDTFISKFASADKKDRISILKGLQNLISIISPLKIPQFFESVPLLKFAPYDGKPFPK